MSDLTFTIAPRPGTDIAQLLLDCERGFEGKCRFPLWQRPAKERCGSGTAVLMPQQYLPPLIAMEGALDTSRSPTGSPAMNDLSAQTDDEPMATAYPAASLNEVG